MIIKTLTPDETYMINEVILLRRKSWDDLPKQKKYLDSIYENLNSEIIELTPMQRAIICGCVREFVIDPNEDLFNQTDMEIFSTVYYIKPRILIVDIAFSILNKLDRHLKNKYGYFAQKLNNIELNTNA